MSSIHSRGVMPWVHNRSLCQTCVSMNICSTPCRTRICGKVAQDPTAAVEAFHTHVNAFLQTLLDVPSSSRHFSSDGIASTHGKGIFGPLSAIFGSIEPQQRGSLRIHFLLFCYAFQDPQSLIQHFAASLDLLEARLWSWIRSIVVTSFEAIPHVFGLPTSSLQHIRPLPYSDTNMLLMHPTYQHHVRNSVDHWFAALPADLLPANPPAAHPFDLDLPANKTFVPWCLDYVHTLRHPIPPDSGRILLYDLRMSVLHSGLLHTCPNKNLLQRKAWQAWVLQTRLLALVANWPAHLGTVPWYPTHSTAFIGHPPAAHRYIPNRTSSPVLWSSQSCHSRWVQMQPRCVNLATIPGQSWRCIFSG